MAFFVENVVEVLNMKATLDEGLGRPSSEEPQ